MKKFSELQIYLEWQYNNFRNKINEQKEYFTKENQILKRELNGNIQSIKRLKTDSQGYSTQQSYPLNMKKK